MECLNNINLNQNELQNAVLHSLSEAPTNPKFGQIYSDSTTKKLMWYNGSSWSTIGSLADIQNLVNSTIKKFSHPRNLLDNSNFKNPVAQAGINGLHGDTKYVIDRWISWDADITRNSGYITTGSSIDQRIDMSRIDTSKTYTVALRLVDGTLYCYTGNFIDSFGAYATIYVGFGGFDIAFVRIGGNQSIVWAALYEGEYNEDTLPDYQPNDYSVELANCQRYGLVLKATHNENIVGFGFVLDASTVRAIIPTPVTMRSTPSLSYLKGETSNILIHTSSGGIHASNISVLSISSNGVTLLIETESGNMIVHDAAVIRFPNAVGYLACDL